MNKVLKIDKPAGWTSFDVVAKVRNEARRVTGDKKIRVGHTGTLDPFATGLLVVLVGKEATKRQDEYMKWDKEYEATVCLGATSTTGDPEGEITKVTNYQLPVRSCHSEQREESKPGSFVPTQDDVMKVLKEFTGEIEQIPPIYSAIKVDGKRAYARARNGEDFVLKPRRVTIHELEIIDFKFPILESRVKCSSGTYIRTLAEDIGKALGTGAYLTALRRTKIGDYDIVDSLTIDEALAALKG